MKYKQVPLIIYTHSIFLKGLKHIYIKDYDFAFYVPKRSFDSVDTSESKSAQNEKLNKCFKKIIGQSYRVLNFDEPAM